VTGPGPHRPPPTAQQGAPLCLPPLTDAATRTAQAASNAQQEYVPTIVYKDDIYRALDTALTGEPYNVRGTSLATVGEDPDGEPVGDNKALARGIRFANEQWDMYADSDDFDPATEYYSWIADRALAWVRLDEKARAQPVELRGAGEVQ
jgi:hypothetical protein